MLFDKHMEASVIDQTIVFCVNWILIAVSAAHKNNICLPSCLTCILYACCSVLLMRLYSVHYQCSCLHSYITKNSYYYQWESTVKACRAEWLRLCALTFSIRLAGGHNVVSTQSKTIFTVLIDFSPINDFCFIFGVSIKKCYSLAGTIPKSEQNKEIVWQKGLFSVNQCAIFVVVWVCVCVDFLSQKNKREKNILELFHSLTFLFRFCQNTAPLFCVLLSPSACDVEIVKNEHSPEN